MSIVLNIFCRVKAIPVKLPKGGCCFLGETCHTFEKKKRGKKE